MKKTLLAIASIFVAFSSVSAQTPTAVNPVADHDYYIYCPAYGEYLCPNEEGVYTQGEAPIIAWHYDGRNLSIKSDGRVDDLVIVLFTKPFEGAPKNYNVSMSHSSNFKGYSDCDYVSVVQVENSSTYRLKGVFSEGSNGTTMYVDGSGQATPSADEYSEFIFVETNPIYTRSMTNEWGTVVLPFAIDYTAENVNCQLYKLSGVNIINDNDGTLSFTECASGETIPAGTPLAVKTSGNSISIAYSEPSSIVSEVKSYTVDGYTMNGAFYEKDNQSGIYFIAEDQFWYAEQAITVPANRAYIEAPAGASSASFRINEVEDTEGIASISNEAQQNGKQMIDGRLVIVKNGMSFDANGRIVR